MDQRAARFRRVTAPRAFGAVPGQNAFCRTRRALLAGLGSVALLLGCLPGAAFAGDPGDGGGASGSGGAPPATDTVPEYFNPWLEAIEKWKKEIAEEDTLDDTDPLNVNASALDQEPVTLPGRDDAPSWFGALLLSLAARSAEVVAAGSGVLVEGSPMGGLVAGHEACEKWAPSMCPSMAQLADEAELGRLQAWADEHPSGGGVVVPDGVGGGGVGGSSGDGVGGAEGAAGWVEGAGAGGGVWVPSSGEDESVLPDGPDGAGDSGQAVDVDPGEGSVDGAGDSGSAFDVDADTDVYDDLGTDTDVYDGSGGTSGTSGGRGGGAGAGGAAYDGGPEFVDPEQGGVGIGLGDVDEGAALDDDTGDGGSTGESGSSEDNTDDGPSSSEDPGSGSGGDEDGGGEDGSSGDDDSGGDDPDCTGDDCGQGGDDGGGYPNPDDPSGGCVGPKCHGDVTERGGEQSNPAELVENPNPDGGGPDGPVVHEGDGSLVMNPNPEEGGPVGPAVHSAPGSLVMNPNPDGGGPDGPVVLPSDEIAIAVGH